MNRRQIHVLYFHPFFISLLYSFSFKDIVELRAKSLELAPSASYRILYETNKASLYFCFVPKNMDMSASSSHPLVDTMMPMDVDQETEDKILSAERSASRSSDESSSIKRQKVK